MPNYDENHKFLGMTFECRLFYPDMFGGYWKLTSYWTQLAEDYFTKL